MRVPTPYLLLTAVALLWAGNAIAGRLAAGHVSPMMLTLLRWALASLAILPFAITPLKRDWPVVRRHLPLLFAYGALGFASFNALLYVALHFTTAINVTIVQAAMPLVVFLGNFALFGTRVTGWQVGGFLLTLLGVVVTAAHGQVGNLLALDFNRGDGLMLLAVLVYGLYTVALRYKPDLDWRTTIFILALAALVTSIPFALLEHGAGLSTMPDRIGWLVVLFTAILPSLLAQSLYIVGVDAIGPNRANLFINLVPIFGAGLAVAILGEKLHTYHLVALVLVLSGITLAQRTAAARRSA